MSIIVSVKINDGIVMAADSATSFAQFPQVYEHANKLVNLVKGLPLGVMTCGDGGIGNASIATLLKDLRKRLAGHDRDHPEWRLDVDDHTMAAVSAWVREFFREKGQEVDLRTGFLLLRICGYSSGHMLPEVWQVAFDNGAWPDPTCIQPEQDFGARWNGEMEALNRLILGIGSVPDEGAKALAMTPQQLQEAANKLYPHTYETLIVPAAPIQEAIDLARFMVETTKGFINFAVRRQKTVGGPVEIAAITKHEGFRWVQRKHFFPSELNLQSGGSP